MPWTLEAEDGLLVVTFRGPFAAAELREATLAIVDALLAQQCLRLLLDCSEAHFDVPTLNVYQLPALYEARGVSRQVRAAVVMPVDGYHAEIFQFYEDVCRNRGYFVQLFPDAAAARLWLKEQPSRE